MTFWHLAVTRHNRAGMHCYHACTQDLWHVARPFVHFRCMLHGHHVFAPVTVCTVVADHAMYVRRLPAYKQPSHVQ